LLPTHVSAQEDPGETCPTIDQSSERRNRFCITGTGTGTGYSVAIQLIDDEGNEVGDPVVSRQNVPGPAPGLNSTKLRDLFVKELSAVLNNRGRASIDGNRDNCFFVSLLDPGIPKDQRFILKVGTFRADADRPVTEEGVSYNPVIQLAPCSLLEVPSLGDGALLLLVLLLALAGLSALRFRP
jgi:hypothetical protein